MDLTRLKQIEEIYHAVVEDAPSDREAFFSARCGGDQDLRREVESILSYDEISDSFIDSSPDAIAADLFAEEDAQEFVGKTVGHYRIERLLGKGGMGKVYLADDTLLSRKVALKVLPPSLIENHDRLKRFKQEAKAASGLNHPNILTIHGFGTDENSNYIVTEFVDGVTLRQKMLCGLTLKEILSITGQAASALAAAHSAGIVHRDIKPENIMIRRDGILKVLDFGLAKLSIPTQLPGSSFEAATMFKTEPGMVMGTLSYMSPEQARGVMVDARTDIWSLGVIIYEMATGKLPFAGPTHSDILVSILNQPAPMIKTFIDNAPAELQRIINKTLAKDSDERYRSMEELAGDLKRFHHRLELEDERQLAHDGAYATDTHLHARETATRMMPAAGVVSPGTFEPAGAATAQSVSRPRLHVLGVAVVLVVLAGIIGIVAWQYSGPGPAAQQTQQASIPAAAPGLPSRVLTYSLTVQSFTDGRYKEPFTLSGEMLFRNRDRIRLNIKSPQSGYLYIVNQGPKSESGEAAYNILFPTPTTNAGNAQLSAGQEIQIPRQSWFELDAKEGTELVWLVWSSNALPELESAKRFANPDDRGRIKGTELINSIESLLQQYQLVKPAVDRDDEKKESRITGSTDIAAHLIKLEHH